MKKSQSGLSWKEIEELKKRLKDNNSRYSSKNMGDHQFNRVMTDRKTEERFQSTFRNPENSPSAYFEKNKGSGGDFEKYSVNNRDGFPFVKDPYALGQERKQRNAENPKQGSYSIYSPNQYDKNAPGNTEVIDPKQAEYYRQQDIETIIRKYNADPNSVDAEEMKYALGERADKPYPFGKQTEEDKKKYVKEEGYDGKSGTHNLAIKQAAINEKTGKNKYSSALGFKELTKVNPDIKNSLNFESRQMERLNKEDMKALKKARENGTEKVYINYNGEKALVPINEVMDYNNSGWKRFTFNNKNKKFVDNIGDKLEHVGMRGLDMLDAVGQANKGYIDKVTEGYGINFGNTIKPLEDIKNKENWKTAFNERLKATEIEKNTSLKDHLRIQGDAIKEGLSSGWKSLNGTYTKHPEEARTMSKMLTEDGWDKNDKSTFWVGLAGDIGSGIVPASVGRTTVLKGGQLVGKNADEVEKQIVRQLGKKSVNDLVPEQQTAVKSVMEKIKNNKKITNDDFSSIYSSQKKAAADDYLKNNKITMRSNDPKQIQDMSESVGRKAQETADEFAKNNKTWQDTLQSLAMGGLQTDNQIKLFGKGIKGSEKIVPQIGQMGGSVGGALGNFNKQQGVNPLVSQKFYDTVGNSNFEKAGVQKELTGLLKGASKKDLENLSKHMVRPDEYALPKVFQTTVKVGEEEKPLINALNDIRNRSFDRDSQFVKDMKKVENYLPGIYKNNEKKVAEKLGFNPKGTKYLNSHKEKTYKDFLETQAKTGLTPVMDAGKLLFKREGDSIDFSNRESFRKWTEDMQKTNPELFNNETMEFVKRYVDPHEFARNPRGAIGSAVKGLQDYWKVATMNLVPATAMRNLYGGVVNNTLDGVGISDYARAGKMQLADILEGVSGGRIKWNPNIKVNGEKMNRKEFIEKGTKAGIDQGQFKADMGEDVFGGAKFGKTNWAQKFNPLNKDEFIAFDPAKAMNGNVEQVLRNARFVKGLDDYGKEGVSNAARDVRRVHFDYNPQTSLTDKEQFIRDYMAPFYTFGKNNLIYQSGKVTENPTMMNFFANQMPDAFAQDDPNRFDPNKPKYMENDLYLGQDAEGNPEYRPSNWNSVNDFTGWFRPGEKLAGMSAPWIKGLLDQSVMDNTSVGGMNMEGDRTPMTGDALTKKAMGTPLEKILGLKEVPQKDGSTWIGQSARRQQVINDIVPQSFNIQSMIKGYESTNPEDSVMKRLLDTARQPKMRNMVTGLEPRVFDSEEQEGYKVQEQNRRADEQMAQLEKDGLLPKDFFDQVKETEKERQVPEYDIERTYRDTGRWFDKISTALQSENQGQYTKDAPLFTGSGNDFYNDVTYSAMGNPISVKFKYANPKGDFQEKQYEHLRNLVDEGLKKEQQDQAKYEYIKSLYDSGQMTYDNYKRMIEEFNQNYYGN